MDVLEKVDSLLDYDFFQTPFKGKFFFGNWNS